MEVKDRIDIFSTLDELRTAVYGDPVKILPETFLMKVKKFKHRFGNTYALRHLNRKDLILIDAIRPENKPAIDQFLDQGYQVRGILLTHGDLIKQAYADLHHISEELGNAPIFMHPLDAGEYGDLITDITEPNFVLEDFGIESYHYPGHTPGSVILYSERNEGMLFAGDSAVGSPYDQDDYYFERPPIENDETDFGLAQNWKRFVKPFKHFLPLHGKPQFGLSEPQQKDIILNLTKDQKTESL
ncbi:MBL fold metallo-hydrolase [Croceiramulus getboli]|nr:MBL fold metallo-hydrolase [Flavobacteriaceae bacterium YJPT1-3]